MAGMLKGSEWEFKTTMVNMLRAVMGKADSMQGQMGSGGKKVEILRTKNKNAKD